jgi:hypothetical protein
MPSIKAIIAIVIGTVLAIGVGVIYFQHGEVKKLDAANATDTVTIKDQAASIQAGASSVALAASAAAITDDSQAALAASESAVSKAHQTVDTQVTQQVQAITKKYAAQPQTASNTGARDNEISQVRITGLWQQYCQGSASDAACAQYKTQ